MCPNLKTFPKLQPGQVHLYLANIQDWLPQSRTLLQTLSESERQRLERYKIKSKADQFLCSRSLLRLILAEYIQQDPAQIHLECTPSGKPFLTGHPVDFNVSHSGDYFLMGISSSTRIGVDIQQIYPIASLEKVIDRYFGCLEQAFLASLDPETRLELFFAIWSAKEAYLKAQGKGFSKSPRTFNLLPISSPSRTFYLTEEGNPDIDSGWTIHELTLPEGYRGAAAVKGKTEGSLFTLDGVVSI